MARFEVSSARDSGLLDCKKARINVSDKLLLLLLLLLLTAIGLSPGGSGYFTCIQNMKLVTTEFKSGGLHEKHVVASRSPTCSYAAVQLDLAVLQRVGRPVAVG